MIKDKVFISYSHRDRRLLNEILEMLEPYVDKGLKLWSDEDIEAGQEWKEKIKEALASARIALLLVTPAFLASRFIRDEELPPLLAAAKRDQTRIFWIPGNHSAYRQTAISDYQSVIPPEKPLMEFKGPKRKKIILDIAEQIKRAWCDPTWSTTLPDDDASSAAIQQFLCLSQRFSALPSETVDQCFRDAVKECFGSNSLDSFFPQLATEQVCNWAILENYFGSICKPSPQLVQALEHKLSTHQLVKSEANECSHLALVVRWEGSTARRKSYYTWKAYVQHGPTSGFQPIKLGGMEQPSHQVVFDKAEEDERPIAFVLRQLVAWAKVHTSQPILEIYAPVDLLDAPWADQVVAEQGNDKITLLEEIPFFLRSVDRLGDSFNSKRPKLINKLQSLSAGKGKWCADEQVLNVKHLRGVLVEKNDVVGVKRFAAFPVDEQERGRWLLALLDSMVPIAIWWRHAPHATDGDCQAAERAWKEHLVNYPMLCANHSGDRVPLDCDHKDGDSVSPDCVRYDELARQRKLLLDDPLASQLVLMLDHWERTPKITPQQRGATRAVSPSPE